ncbi:MAG: ribokinase [Planctomycetota bacterium]|jgi:ribokinase
MGGGRVVVVGSSNTDMVAAALALPRPGETLVGGEFYTAAGGKGANQAVAAARAGGKGSRVTFVAAVGDDEFGRAAVKGFKTEGIDCRRVRTVKGRPSGVALIMVGRGGENMIVVAPGANAELAPRDVALARAEIAKADILLAQLETPLPAVARALKLAVAAGARTILNPAPAPAKRLPASLLKDISVLTPNETEFEAITGCEPSGTSGLAAARRLARKVGEALVVTEGARGARVFMSSRAKTDGSPCEFRVPAFKARAVDTVAAGDAFSGALAMALAEGEPLPEALRFASAAAAISVTRRGAQPGLPTRREIAAFLRKRAKRRR